jgi:excisionase family DNA binding protein
MPEPIRRTTNLNMQHQRETGAVSQQSSLNNAWLTAEEAAQYLKVKRRTLLLWARQGKIKGYVLSGTARHVWRFRQADLDDILELPSVRPEGMVQ